MTFVRAHRVAAASRDDRATRTDDDVFEDWKVKRLSAVALTQRASQRDAMHIYLFYQSKLSVMFTVNERGVDLFQ